MIREHGSIFIARMFTRRVTETRCRTTGVGADMNAYPPNFGSYTNVAVSIPVRLPQTFRFLSGEPWTQKTTMLPTTQTACNCLTRRCHWLLTWPVFGAAPRSLAIAEPAIIHRPASEDQHDQH